MTLQEVMKFHHPYLRYGWAVALHQSKKSPVRVNISEIPAMLIKSIEFGLGDFRYRTDNNPATDDILKYEKIGLTILRRDATLVQSAGLSAKGCYLAPSIISTDGDAKGTFENSEAIIKELRTGDNLLSKMNASRSFAPTTSKTNDGKSSQSPPKITLFEAACSVITTITPLKPAFLLIGEMRYTGIIPDVPIEDLKRFIELFEEMQTQDVAEKLMEHKIHRKSIHEGPATKKGKNKTKKSTLFDESGIDDGITKKESEKIGFKRPRIHDGNYPYAPYDNNAFGAVGVLAAMEQWAEKAKDRTRVQAILRAIAGDEQTTGAPLYVVSYDKISHVQFSHHIAQLAIDNKLRDIIASLSRDTVLYSEMDATTPKYDNQNYKLFNMMAGRFLQQFNEASFRDFLAFRAEYSTTIQPLFARYFMNRQNTPISREVVESARAFGQWLNYAAYRAADELYDKNVADRNNKVAKEKAKVLAELESTSMSSENSLELLARISIRAGRYLQSDAPPNTALFMDAVASGEVGFEDAKNLILAYSRLAKKWEKKIDDVSTEGDDDGEDDETTDNETTNNDSTN